MFFFLMVFNVFRTQIFSSILENEMLKTKVAVETLLSIINSLSSLQIILLVMKYDYMYIICYWYMYIYMVYVHLSNVTNV